MKQNTFKTAMLMMALLLLCLSFTKVQADDAKFPPLMFLQGEVQFSLNTPVIADSRMQAIAHSAVANTKLHLLMQFQQLPSDQVKSKLDKNGITLLDYMPKNAYWVSIDQQGIAYAENNLVNTDGKSGHILWSPPKQYKMSRRLVEANYPDYATIDDEVKLLAIIHSDIFPADAEAVLRGSGKVSELSWKDKNLVQIQVNKSQVGEIAEMDVIQWLEIIPPKYTTNNATSSQRIHVNTIKASPLGLDGTGVAVGVWDGGRVGTHQDLTGRFTVLTSEPDSDHATHVTGTIIGDGTGNSSAEGMATNANVRSWSYKDNNWLTDFRNESSSENIEIANWSFGYVIGWNGNTYHNNIDLFGKYNSEARTIDDIVADEGVLVFKSSGNHRNDCNPDNNSDCDGETISGIDGYDTIGALGTAKNIVTIGATTDSDAMTGFSSWGPTNDHRVKPDLCANGDTVNSTLPSNNYGIKSGTSMASPAAAGAATLLYEHYNNVYGSFPDDAAIIKGVMIHTATNLGATGPDARYGWGLIDANKAAKVITDQHIEMDSIATLDAVKTIQITVPSSANKMKVTLVWTDPQGALNSSVNLINNLDLRLVDPSGTTHLPWALSLASSFTTAIRGDNDSDNVEQVSVNNPVAGTWTVQVVDDGIPTGPQDYALIFDYDKASTKPVLISPNGTISDTTPTYTWNAVGGATWYKLYVNDSTGNKLDEWVSAASAGCLAGSGTCSTTPSTALANGNGQWWVRAWSSPDFIGLWSNGMSFNVSDASLGKPTLISPSGSISDTTPAYVWNAVSGATWYKLFVNDSTGNVIDKWVSATSAGCASGSGTCTTTPSTTLAIGGGIWWAKAWNSGVFGLWSNGMSFYVSDTTLGKPTLISPSGMISDTTPTYTWNAVLGSTWYKLFVNDSTGNIMDKWVSAASAGCASGSGTCSTTPSTALASGSGVWWARAWNSSGFGSWSTSLAFSVSAAGCAINDQFSGGSAANWVQNSGTWTESGGAWQTVGQNALAQTSSHTSNNCNDVDITARMWRSGADGESNTIHVRASGGTTSFGYFNNGYVFQYNRNGSYSIFKGVSGSFSALQSWVSSGAINTGGAWNKLRIVINGSAIKFYINDTLVWTGSDASLSTGKVGVGMYSEYASDGNHLWVDYITAGAPSNSANAVQSTVSVEQNAANQAANKLPVGNINSSDGQL